MPDKIFLIATGGYTLRVKPIVVFTVDYTGQWVFGTV